MGTFPNKETQFSSENQPDGRGRPKGRKSLATIIRDLEDEEFDWNIIPVKDKDDDVLNKYRSVGAPFKAIVMVAFKHALMGDTRAMEWLRKAGYGDQVDVTSKGETIAPRVVSVILPHVRSQTQTEPSDTISERSED